MTFNRNAAAFLKGSLSSDASAQVRVGGLGMSRGSLSRKPYSAKTIAQWWRLAIRDNVSERRAGLLISGHVPIAEPSGAYNLPSSFDKEPRKFFSKREEGGDAMSGGLNENSRPWGAQMFGRLSDPNDQMVSDNRDGGVDRLATADLGSKDPVILIFANIVMACIMGAVVSGIPLPVPFADVSLGRAGSYVAYMMACIALTVLYWVAGWAVDGGWYTSGAGAVAVGMLFASLLYIGACCFVIPAFKTTIVGAATLGFIGLLVVECIRVAGGGCPMWIGNAPVLGWHRVVAVGFIGWVLFLPALGVVPCDVAAEDLGGVEGASAVVESRWEESSPEGRLALLRGLAVEESERRGLSPDGVQVEAGAFGLMNRIASRAGYDGRTIYVNLGMLADRRAGGFMSAEVLKQMAQVGGSW